MDALTVLKVGKKAADGLKALGVELGPLTRVLPVVGVATTCLTIKKWIDSEDAKMLNDTRSREECPHIVMIEGPYSASILAASYVVEHGGIAWMLGEMSLFFWHSEATFQPLVFSEAYIPTRNGVRRVGTLRDYSEYVPRPKKGYGCSQCKAFHAKKQSM